MKKHALKLFAVAVLLTAAAAPAVVRAQSARRIVVHIPFEFIVGRKTLPAGEYTVSQALRNSDKVLVVRGAGGAEMIVTGPAEAGGARRAEQAARLDFHQYGEQYFLFRVWAPGASVGRELPVSDTERSIENDLAVNAPKDLLAKNTTGRQLVSVTGRVK
ncbi:MAG: hypothetical protein ACRD68_06070 [Pyrinomonadaceae bacterium]